MSNDIRICPTCGQVQHLEKWGRQGVIYVHGSTGQSTCQLGSNDDHESEHKPRKRRKDAGVPKELTEEHKRKMQEARERKRKEREKAEKVDLKDTIKRLEKHVVKAQRECDSAYTKMRKSGSDKNFNAWIRADANLLNAITALRAHQSRLASEE